MGKTSESNLKIKVKVVLREKESLNLQEKIL
jgi:hypothetical protein